MNTRNVTFSAVIFIRFLTPRDPGKFLDSRYYSKNVSFVEFYSERNGPISKGGLLDSSGCSFLVKNSRERREIVGKTITRRGGKAGGRKKIQVASEERAGAQPME